tara:strand:+ start:10171 stop:10296 length:126 start_codon:yes stop_codon:yes gene_type:complete
MTLRGAAVLVRLSTAGLTLFIPIGLNEKTRELSKISLFLRE